MTEPAQIPPCCSDKPRTEDNNGNSIWKQKPQIKKKKRKKINWDQLQLINDPKLGLQANLKSNPDNPKSMTKPQSGKSKLPTKL